MIKSYAAKEREAGRFSRDMTVHHGLVVAQRHEGHLVAFAGEVLGHMGKTIVLGYEGWLALQGDLTAGMLTRFLGYVGIIYGPIRRVADLNIVYQSSLAAMVTWSLTRSAMADRAPLWASDVAPPDAPRAPLCHCQGMMTIRHLRWTALLTVFTACTGTLPPEPGSTSSSGGATVSSSALQQTSSRASSHTQTSSAAVALSSSHTQTPSSTMEPEATALSFMPSDEEILNPERGFYDGIDLTDPDDDYAHVRERGRTLAYAGVNLEDFRASPIDAAFLASLESGFTRVRAAGFKVILRFVYNDCQCDDAPLARVKEHINQLHGVVTQNSDVIAVVQAGFIGGWGEWHGSTNNLDNTAARTEIMDAMLDSFSFQLLQLRTPGFKKDLYGAALTEAEAFNPLLHKARIGHHNDCFLASDSDFGTYSSPYAEGKAFVAQEGRFTPVGGETCAVNEPRSQCASAVAEMSALHWSYINSLYHQSVLASWTTDGCMTEVKKRLGYRLELASASVNTQVKPGGVLRLEFSIRNTGWAAPFKARPVFAALDDGVSFYTVQLPSVDPRRWESGMTSSHSVNLRVPANVTPRAWRLSLWLPEEWSSLRNRPEYSGLS